MKRYITWGEVFSILTLFEEKYKDYIVYGIPKGGMIAAGFLKNMLTTYDPSKAGIFLDDLIDSGATKKKYKLMYPNTPFVALFDKPLEGITDWLIFPWESDHPVREDTVEQNIVRLLEYIGEDPKREGLLKTPERVVKSYSELFAGYKKKPAELMTVFEKETYDEMVICKDIEIYSTCEHHMLPFFGKAHIAYIPDKKVIGLSKLPRLLEVFARRLQIQERIGEQVTEALMTHLKPLGAACIIEAKHTCTCSRGVNKQNSVMITSSLKGVFKDNHAAREELMQLILK